VLGFSGRCSGITNKKLIKYNSAVHGYLGIHAQEAAKGTVSLCWFNTLLITLLITHSSTSRSLATIDCILQHSLIWLIWFGLLGRNESAPQ